MLGTLLKKQLLQLHTFYFFDAKKGKQRSPVGIIGMIALFALVIYSLAFSMCGLGDFLLKLIHPMNMDWLYFAIMGTMALLAGILGGAFISYPTIYKAKDNDLLLSMPVSPSNIILARMLSVFIMCFIYGSIVWIPTMIVYLTHLGTTGISLFYAICSTFIISAIVLAFSCLIGWIIALISSRIKNKSFASIAISLLIIFVYYICYFKINTYLTLLTTYIDKIAEFYDTYLAVLSQLGRAATGDTKAFLYFLGFAVLLFLVTWFILKSTFIRVVTHSAKFKKTAFQRKSLQQKSISSTLLKKEFKHFWNSPVYVVNCGLSLVIELGAAVFLLIRKDKIREYLGYILNITEDMDLTVFFSVGIAVLVTLLASMAFITAPSISLEGKNIWILQSLPIPAWKVFEAKQRLHIILNVIPAALCTAAAIYVLQIEWLDAIFIALFVFVYILLNSVFGLLVNLKFPNLTWTNEAVPVKQGIAVLFAMFGGWVFCLATGGVFFAVSDFMPGNVFLPIVTAIMLIFVVVLNRWLYKSGEKIFSKL